MNILKQLKKKLRKSLTLIHKYQNHIEELEQKGGKVTKDIHNGLAPLGASLAEHIENLKTMQKVQKLQKKSSKAPKKKKLKKGKSQEFPGPHNL